MKEVKIKNKDTDKIHNKKSKALLTYTINEKNCVGCGKCKKKCPEDAVRGKKKEIHKIKQDKCIHCGKCFVVCKHKAVLVDQKRVGK